MTLPGDPFDAMPSEKSEAYEPGAWLIGGDAFEAAQIPPIRVDVMENFGPRAGEWRQTYPPKKRSLREAIEAENRRIRDEITPILVRNILDFKYHAPTVDRLFQGPGAEGQQPMSERDFERVKARLREALQGHWLTKRQGRELIEEIMVRVDNHETFIQTDSGYTNA